MIFLTLKRLRLELHALGVLLRRGHNDDDHLSLRALSAKLDATADLIAAAKELKAATRELKKAVEANRP